MVMSIYPRFQPLFLFFRIESGTFAAKRMAKSFIDLIKQVDNAPYPHESNYTKFHQGLYTLISHDGQFQLGYLTKPIVNLMTLESDVFTTDDESKTVQLNPALSDSDLRTSKLNKLAAKWKDNDELDLKHGWRNEQYTIYDTNHKEYFRLERSACPWFGVVMYGVHINGYVKTANGEIKMWVPKRSLTKQTYPGKLDNTVAGGLGYPYGIMETCYKECWEEAGLEESYTKDRLTNVGVISYLYQFDKSTVQPEVEYIFDLDMSDGKIPHPVDNESMDFQLLSIEEIICKLKDDEFKHNCSSVVIDFLIRHGIITSSNESDYIEINNRLHRYLEFPLRGE